LYLGEQSRRSVHRSELATPSAIRDVTPEKDCEQEHLGCIDCWSQLGRSLAVSAQLGI